MSGHTDFLKRYRKIGSDQEDIQFAKEKLLRDSGWQHSSSYADCHWRWSKTVEGKLITTTDADEALRLEERITPCNEDCKHDD